METINLKEYNHLNYEQIGIHYDCENRCYMEFGYDIYKHNLTAEILKIPSVKRKVVDEEIKEEMIKDLGNLHELFVAFHDKYKIPQTKFIIDENIIVYDVLSGNPVIYYEPDFYKT